MKTKEINGITLIALVITIIVLLILAGVTIATLTGNDGIMNKAGEAKEKTEIASEKEAIEVMSLGKELSEDDNLIGTALYDRTNENGNKWHIIKINEEDKNYGTGWYYIDKGTQIDNYGDTKYQWVVNYETGEVIYLEKESFTEMAYGMNLAVKEGLILNIDPINMENGNPENWGENVELYGFDEDQSGWSETGITFDGIDDYISFKAGTDFEKGFTFSFYGIQNTNNNEGAALFTKQSTSDARYSCRFSLSPYYFRFNTSKNVANSPWESTQANMTGMMKYDIGYKVGEEVYVDLTFDSATNTFTIYQNGEYLDSTTTDNNYWWGENGGKQVFEDDSISCYLGRAFGGTQMTWYYSKPTIYSLRLYNNPLTETQIKENYEKTTSYHELIAKENEK